MDIVVNGVEFVIFVEQKTYLHDPQLVAKVKAYHNLRYYGKIPVIPSMLDPYLLVQRLKDIIANNEKNSISGVMNDEACFNIKFNFTLERHNQTLNLHVMCSADDMETHTFIKTIVNKIEMQEKMNMLEERIKKLEALVLK